MKQNKILIMLTEEEWVEVMKLVDAKSENGYTARNMYNDLKDKMLFQWGIGEEENAKKNK
jgi:hypothetical protein